MANNNHGWGWLWVVASATLLAISAAIAPSASAQVTKTEISGGPARLVDLKSAPEVPAVPQLPGLVTNRPTIPMADYLAATNAAATKVGAARPQTGTAPPPAAGVSLYTQVGSTNESQTTGGNRRPPGGDIATSANWMVQVNNNVVVMYNWFTNAFVSKNLATFFADGTHFLFDPRVIYDPYWDRFIVLVDACTNCGTASNASRLAWAVSTTGDPTGGWYVGGSSFGTGLGDFIDFPQLGMDLHSIIMTFNNFPPPGFGGLNGATFAISKAYLYNGLAWHSYIFTGSACTVAPPYVLDNNGVDYVMAFCPGDDKVWIGSLTNSGLSNVHLNLWDNTVSVPVFGIPPDAPQFHYSLDTGDNRFENRSVQVGSRILNTATISFDRGAGARATAAWFDFNIDASPHTGQSYGLWFGSTTSSDWHPSINANTVGASSRLLGETFGTWMSVDQANNINVQLRAIGATGDDAGYGSGITVYTGPWALTNQTDSNGIHRTGDYSYIALYPAAALGCTQPNEIGILTGETAGPSLGLWGTRVGIVKHC